jgi:hypothetical protein
VYWSVPKGWFPGGLYLSASDAELLLGVLCRLPAAASRDALLARISAGYPERAAHLAQLKSVIHESPEQEPLLELVTDAAARRQALHVHYFSATRGALEWRHVSVQRVLTGPPARLIAHCHRSSTLKWFRADGIVAARVDPAIAYVLATPAAIDELASSSVDGFTAPGSASEQRFFVPDPDARWVERNLLSGMHTERVEGGIRITSRTPTPLRMARFVLSLAPVARAETQELALLVAQLGEAMATTHGRAKSLRAGDFSTSAGTGRHIPARRAVTRRTGTPRRSA